MIFACAGPVLIVGPPFGPSSDYQKHGIRVGVRLCGHAFEWLIGTACAYAVGLLFTLIPNFSAVIAKRPNEISRGDGDRQHQAWREPLVMRGPHSDDVPEWCSSA